MKLHYTGCFLVFLGLILNFSTLPGQVPELLLPIGHSGALGQASYSPDGERIVTVSADKTVKIWDVETGRLLLTIGHRATKTSVKYSEHEMVITVIFSPDGKSVMTKSDFGSIKIWDSNSGKLLLNPSDPDNYGIRDVVEGSWNVGYYFKKVKYSPDGKYLFVMRDTVIIMWDVQSGKLHHILEGHKGQIQSIDFSPDGRTMLSTSADGMAIIWDAQTGNMIRILEGSKEIYGMSGATFSPEGKQILAISEDGSANIWNASTGNLIRTLETQEGYSDFSGAKFTPDGKNIMTLSGNKLEIWDPESGNLLFTINTWEESEICFSPDYQRILSASSMKQSDGEYGFCVGLYDAKNGRLLHIYDDPPGYRFPFYYIGFSPDGKNIMAISDKCRVWDAETRNILFTIEGLFDDVSTVIYTSDGKGMCLISGASSGLYDRTNGRLIQTYNPPAKIWDDLSDNEKPLYATGLSPNRKSFYISSFKSISVKIFGTHNGELKQDLTGHSTPVTEAVFSADGKNILSKFFCDKPFESIWDIKYFYDKDFVNTSEIVNQSSTAKVWDITNGKILYGLKGQELSSASFGDGDKIIRTLAKAPSGKTTVNTLDAHTGNILNSVDLQADTVSLFIFSPDNKTIVAIDTNYSAKILSTKTGEELHRLTGHVAKAKYSPDSKNLLTTSWWSFVNVWDVESGRLVKTLRENDDNGTTHSFMLRTSDHYESSNYKEDSIIITPETPIDRLPYQFKRELLYLFEEIADFSADGKSIITGSTAPIVLSYSNVWDIQSQTPSKSFWGTEAVLDPEENSVLTFNHFVEMDTVNYSSYRVAAIWDFSGETLLYKLNLGDIAIYSPDGDDLFAPYVDSAKIWNAKNGQLKRAIYFSGTFCDLDWKNNRMMIHDNSKLVFFDIRTGQELFSLIAIDSVDYIVLTPDKYYMCSKNAANKLSWLVGDKLYSFDQFDLQYNRPDIVLERLGNPDTALIKMYRKAYEKRLRKAGFKEGMFSPDWHTPEMKILNSETISNITDQSNVQLKICGTDSKYNLNRLLVWVNDVPVYGANGISILEEKTDSIVRTININLSAGDNNIKVSCINEKGVESLKKSLDVIFNPQKTIKPDLYIIAMSVSDYKDNRYDLQYAAKDGKDIASLFSSLKDPEGGYGKVFIDTLFNKKAIRKNFFKLKQKLSASKVDDEVVVFVSGHGLLNKNLDFYYATYNIDFRNPQKNGISFDELESILDGIPARKKLLLMDACHSGEVDKEETNNLTALNTEKAENITFRGAVKEYSYKGVDAGAASSGLSSGTTLELMQELFAGLDQGTGTTVISAAAGKGYALESPQWNNGIFTYSIINGLKNRAADKNKNGTISVSELKDYSIKQVQLLTGGRQKPTARRESINYDWKIW